MRGHVPWNKGKKGVYTEAMREKMSVGQSKPVVCLNTGEHFVGGLAAARAFGIGPLSVNRCCNGTVRCTRSGLRFAFVGDTPDGTPSQKL